MGRAAPPNPVLSKSKTSGLETAFTKQASLFAWKRCFGKQILRAYFRNTNTTSLVCVVHVQLLVLFVEAGLATTRAFLLGMFSRMFKGSSRPISEFRRACVVLQALCEPMRLQGLQG